LAVHVTPVVDLKAIWWATVSLFVNCTVSPWATDVELGTGPFFVIVTVTVLAIADPTEIATSATTADKMSLRIWCPFVRLCRESSTRTAGPPTA
jgi:hypothetical protein